MTASKGLRFRVEWMECCVKFQCLVHSAILRWFSGLFSILEFSIELKSVRMFVGCAGLALVN